MARGAFELPYPSKTDGSDGCGCRTDEQGIRIPVRRLEDEYQVNVSKVLGHGTCGVVRPAWPRSGNALGASIAAIKSVPIKRRHAAYEEVAILGSLDHPHICKLLGVLEDDESVHFVLEHIGGGDLCDHLLASGPMEERLAGTIAQQVFSALLHCHENHGVIHGDVKPENIMICAGGASGISPSPTPFVKLIDFGTAVRGAGFYAARGTHNYMSPELRVLGYRSPSSDMWAMGIVLYVMLTNRFPGHVYTKGGESHMSSLLEASRRGGAKRQRCLLRLPEGPRDLIDGLLQIKPSLRPNARAAQTHPWATTPGT